MDPATMLTLLAIALFVRNAFEDGWAAIRGRESPRIARRRAAAQIAREQADRTDSPTVREAVAGRVAQRIADRPQHRFVRSTLDYLGERYADALSDALRNRRANPPSRPGWFARLLGRVRPDGAADEPAVLVARYCRGRCGRLVTYDGLCGDCRRHDQTDPDPADAAVDEVVDADVIDEVIDEPAPPPPTSWPCLRRCGRTNPYPDTVCGHCVYAEHQAAATTATDPPADPHDETATPETQEPTPAPATTTEGTTTMSQPSTVEIDGDVQDPFGARARAQACVDTAEQIIGLIDVCASNLEGLGVGADAVGVVRALADDIAPYIAAGEAAVAVFDRHATTAAEIGARADVAGTTTGTYLDGANA